MALSKPVSTSTEPNDNRDDSPLAPDGMPYKPLPEAVRNSPNYFPTYIPADQFDRIRMEARTAKYDNAIQERATIEAVDDAIFERVRPMEARAIEDAESLLKSADPRQSDGNGQPIGNPLQVAESRVAELHAIRDALREGRVSTAELAERYKKVQNAIQYGDAHALIAQARRAKFLSERLADPLAHTQKVMSKLPLGHWRGLGIRNW